MSKSLGDAAEATAARELERRGYTILTRNYRVAGGELDLVARDGRVICFVEVRSRASAAYGRAEETIGRTKRERIALAASHWLAKHRMEEAACRFDVVAIAGDEVTVIADAFRLED